LLCSVGFNDVELNTLEGLALPFHWLEASLVVTVKRFSDEKYSKSESKPLSGTKYTVVD
jgi:hypothetical protein